MERPRTLDPMDLNSTENPQLKAFFYSISFTFFVDFQKQRLFETKHPHFCITKFKIFRYGAFA